MTHYLATVSMPGNEPASFDTAREAWWHLYHHRCDAERNAPCDLCDDTMTHGPMGDCDDDSETGDALSRRASDRWMVCDFERVGTVHGPTPGYRGDNDPGLTYSVIEIP